ncbi:3-phosphoshikimate 1-carboxyvinyltransferase [Anaerococcus sp. AGMB00486]|uniref:3-phosphoshikimate 1-carboxyvinyltransferase n=2 Tax=Anaerococcus TaxID=165779 RepID=A0ABX2N9Z4_9FIRM|nr:MULTISPECIES: 3-phosphoshikimate 1-carboxyvinyltransferase [Anaerococcus]MSS78466.1 3-phosphoshikimate 1-carboxyvinyltransferase [Anaerococcus porci]NVF11322.1 3-phosphoshikimate 1-carboxyvinyltransferase [Anaerococcus faecalis]
MKTDKITIKKGKLKGEIDAISSKSFAHRALIMAGLSDSPTEIFINEFSKDINVTIKALEDLGAYIERYEDKIILIPSKKKLNKAIIDMYESGSSLRFFTAVSTHFAKEIKIIGEKRLSQRPNLALIENLRENGLSIDNDRLPFTISGDFLGGNFKLSHDESSQYITALLLAGSKSARTFIELDNLAESVGYVDITIDVLKDFNVDVIKEGFSYKIENPKIISPKKYYVEGDWSNSAFFYGANLLGSDIKINNLNFNTSQKDKEIISIIERIKEHKNNGKTLKIDISQIPDLAPITAILLTTLDKPSYIVNGKRLRIKESDRLISTCQMLNNLGAKAEIRGDDLKVEGKIKGGVVDSFNDHRIVMAASIASNLASEDITILDYKAVNKSYPNFFNDFEKLGGELR